jgi:hypothetical protein
MDEGRWIVGLRSRGTLGLYGASETDARLATSIAGLAWTNRV